MSIEIREIMQPPEAANFLGWNKETLLRQCRRGCVPYRKLNARRIVFLRSELIRWVDRLPGRSLSQVIDR